MNDDGLSASRSGVSRVKSGASVRRMLGAAGLAVVATFCAPASPGMADDAGIGAFFREQFGIGGDAPPAPAYEVPDERPITVRPRQSHVVSRRPHAAVAVGPVAPVSIYEDKTLRPGDAVMTKTGVRIFLGGHGTPYTENDFAALSDAEGLSKQTERALFAIDKAPRG